MTVLAPRSAGLLLAAVGALGAASAMLGLLGPGSALPALVLLALTAPLMPAADAVLRGPTGKAHRLRATLGLLTWFAGAGIVVFGPALGQQGLVPAGLALAAFSGAALVLAGAGLLRPGPSRRQRRRARGRDRA